MSLTCEIKFVVQFYILPLPSRLRHATHRILNRRRKSGYLGYHLENSEDICTSHHKVLLPKEMVSWTNNQKLWFSHLETSGVAGCLCCSLQVKRLQSMQAFLLQGHKSFMPSIKLFRSVSFFLKRFTCHKKATSPWLSSLVSCLVRVGPLTPSCFSSCLAASWSLPVLSMLLTLAKSTFQRLKF